MSKDIPLAILRPGGQCRHMIHSDPYIAPVDWKKEAELMRMAAAKVLKNKRTARAFLKKVGFDLKTGKLIRPGRA